MDEVNGMVLLTVHQGVSSSNRARNSGAHTGGVAGKLNLTQVARRSAGEQARNNSGQEHHDFKWSGLERE